MSDAEMPSESGVDERRSLELSKTCCMAFTVDLSNGKSGSLETPKEKKENQTKESEERRMQLNRPIRAFVPKRLLQRGQEQRGGGNKNENDDSNDINNDPDNGSKRQANISRRKGATNDDEADSSLSDTGTYVIDDENDDDDEQDATDNDLSALLVDSRDKDRQLASSRVQEWSDRNEVILHKTSSMASNVSNSSRRRLPDVPPSESTMTNALLRETYETMTAMEERIKASSRLNSPKHRQTTNCGNSTVLTKKAAKEEEAKKLKRLAWERRKNYDPKQFGTQSSNRNHVKNSISKQGDVGFDHGHDSDDAVFVRSEEEERLCVSMHVPATLTTSITRDSDLRTNRAFALRQQMNKTRPSTAQSLMQRAEQARRSLRDTSKEKVVNKGAIVNQRRTSGSGINGSRSGPGGKSASTLTSKEADFLAWRRRKEYKPSATTSTNNTGSSGHQSLSPVHNSMNTNNSVGYNSSGPLGRHLAKRSSQGTTAVAVVTPSSLLQTRSASFHYPEGESRGRRGGARVDVTSSEEDDEYPSLANVDVADPADIGDLDEDEFVVALGQRPSSSSSTQKQQHYMRSLRGSASKYLQPLASSGVNVHNRKPNKRGDEMETLDTLVISTLFSLSARLCRKSSRLIRKAEQQQKMDDKSDTNEQLALMDTLLYVLDDCELPSSPSKQSSRELAGALRNLKKVEQAMQVLEETCFLIE